MHMKTVRFSQVVARAGPPEVHVSWLPPAKDPVLKRALKEHRVMTVHQELRGTRKDFGTVGLALKGPAQILLFPKSLRRFAERKVVGIDYEVLPKPSDRSELSSAAHLEPQTDRGGKSRRKEGLRVDPNAILPRPGSNGSTQPRTSQRALRVTNRAVPAAAKTPVHSPLRRTAEPVSREKLLAIIRRAVADLKVGRAVPAYERLQAALAEERQ